jgi:TonB family protein
MKNSLLILLLSLTSSIYAQDTLSFFVNAKGNATEKEIAHYHRIALKTDSIEWTVIDYTMEDKLFRSGNYETKKLKNAIGMHLFYYDSGEIKAKGPYKENFKSGKWLGYFKSGKTKYRIHYLEGKLHGPIFSYWESGIKRRVDQFKEGEFIQGRCYDGEGIIIPHYDFNKMPEFPGGIGPYLGKTVTFPKEAKANGISGRVYINFVVNKDGNVEQVKVLRGVHPLLDTEALRVVKAMPQWIPGIKYGDKVDVSYHLPLNFKLQSPYIHIHIKINLL